MCKIILISCKCFLLNQLLEDNVDDDSLAKSDDHLTSAKMEVEANHGSSAVPNSAEDSNLKRMKPSSVSSVSSSVV